MSIRPLKAKPSTKQRSANGTRRRTSGAARAPTTPQPPQASICHGVQGPCPRKKFDTSAASAPTPKPARAPSAAPAATAITVTGWTPGIAAKRTRPPAAAAASVATSASDLLAPRPGSSQAAPATSSAAATRSKERAPCCGEVAAQAAAAKATTAATEITALGIDELPVGLKRDDPVGHGFRERAIVGDDERRSRRVRPQQLGKLVLALRIDATRGLVQDEQVGLGHEHRRQREPLALPAREVARVPVLVAREADRGERPARGRQVAVDADRDFLARALAEDVAAGVLREVGRPPAALDAAAERHEQPGRELRERRLAGSVRTDERDDLAAPQFQARTVEDEQVIFVGVGNPVQARRDFTEVMVVYTYITTGRNKQGMVLFEPCLGLADRAIERQASPVEEENPVADLERQGRQLLGEQHSRTAVTGEPQGQLNQPLGGLWVELRRRLVEKQELRLECQRRSEADALQLAARELGHEPLRQMLCADPGEGVERTRFDLLCRGADVLEAERDLVEDAGEDDLVLRVLKKGRNGAG